MGGSSDADICSPEELRKHDAQDNTINWNIQDFRNIAWGLSAICVVVSVILTIILIFRHMKHFHRPSQQKHIARILIMVPIYSIDSWLSFRLYWLSVYFDLFRDCYEAFVINEFYNLLIEYTGGYKRSKELFATKPSFKLVMPLCCWTVAPKRGLLRTCKRLTLQYVVLRPFLSALALFLNSFGEYCPGALTAFTKGYVYITGIMLVSVTVAMYALILFYVVAKEELTQYNPVPKFLSIKFIIAMSFWQSVVVAGLIKFDVIGATAYWTSDNVSEGVQDFLICVEMLVVAIWHNSAFSYKEFAVQGPQPTGIWKSFAISFNPVDIVSDIWKSYSFIFRCYCYKGERHKKFDDEDEGVEMSDKNLEQNTSNLNHNGNFAEPAAVITNISGENGQIQNQITDKEQLTVITHAQTL